MGYALMGIAIMVIVVVAAVIVAKGSNKICELEAVVAEKEKEIRRLNCKLSVMQAWEVK